LATVSSEAAKKLDESQERLDFLAETAGVGLWVWDRQFDRLAVDSGTEQLYGLRSGDVHGAGATFARIVHPDDLEMFRAAASASTHEPRRLRIRMAPVHGAPRIVDIALKTSRRSMTHARTVLIITGDRDGAAEAVLPPQQEGQKEITLIERVGVATQAAGVKCWEFSYLEDRFTWYDRLSQEPTVNAAEILEGNRDLAETIFPEDQIAMRKAVEQALAAGAETLSSVMRKRDAAGNTHHYKVHQRFFRDEAGRPLRAVGATRDITAEIDAAEEMRQQTELLRETQRRLDRASLSIQEGHWELELLTGRHWASKSYLALLGYSEDTLDLDSLEKVKAIIHPDDAPAATSATRRHLAGDPPYDVEVRLRAADGTYRWFRLRGTAERDANGQPLRMSGSIHDIQKLRLAEDALRDVQARFARAIHGTQDGLWEVDFDRGTMWLSPRLCELLGYEDGELSDDQDVLRNLVHPEHVADSDAAIHASGARSIPIDLETRMRTKTGEYRWYRLRGTPPMDYPGQGRRSSGSMQDVTEAHGAREVLVQATEAAQAANRAKSGFLANVSHEIRTPMNGIIGMAQLLFDTSLDPTQREYVDTIRASGDSLLAVINDILDFSKIEAGKLHIEMLEMHLPEIIEDIGSIMAFQAAAKNIELIVNVHPDVPRNVLGDPQRIRQCIINLIGNAIKFTSLGEIVCEVRLIESRADSVQVRFEVRDTGIGIAGDILQSLFQPFMQADASTTRHYGGTGLGLSIVHRLVELMGGENGVESQVGKGSTFWFELPMTRAKATADDATARSATSGHRLLVVDDNETNRRVLQTQLAYAGYEVVLAGNGKDALAALRSGAAAGRPFDLALVDFKMPDMDGAVLGQAINADPFLSRTRVILLTSVDRHGDLARFAAMGFAGYLSKPLRSRELADCLERVLSRDAKDWRLQTQPMVTPSAALRSSKPGRFSGRVLLVEDNIVNQMVARRFLERLGCDVTVAENGEEAVRCFKQSAFRLVLMDVQMPIMDGYTATRQIRSLEDTYARIPIVALTANAMTGQLEQCVEAGMDALLTKPLNVERLEEALVRFGLLVSSGSPDRIS
jgi:two-component system sensor histidine kinase/response regulator